LIFRIYSLFPEFFESPLKCGLLGKAITGGLIDVSVVDIRSYSLNKHRRCDDYPYGGGSGMVIMPEPLFAAFEANETGDSKVIYMSPSGRLLNQGVVKRLSKEKEISILCGNYEGIDQRVIDSFVDEEISIGDYVLSGGEFAALILLDSVARYIPGFMSNEESLLEESFESDLLEYPQWTRPAEFRGHKVPEVLLSGDHDKIKNWRHEKRIEKTRLKRPDLYKKYLERLLLRE